MHASHTSHTPHTTRDLFLIRHGQTAWNAEGRMQGWNDNPLDDTGRAQVIQMGHYLRDHALRPWLGSGALVALWSSPIGRALESAHLLALPLPAPKLHDGLREFDMGSWSGQLASDLRLLPAWQAFLKDPGPSAFPNGEAFVDVCQRGQAAIHDILARETADAIVLVSHGGLIKTLIITLLGLPSALYHRFMIANASLTHIRFTPDHGFVFRCINQTAPLP